MKSIEDATQAETRKRRIAKTIEKLRAGEKGWTGRGRAEEGSNSTISACTRCHTDAFPNLAELNSRLVPVRPRVRLGVPRCGIARVRLRPAEFGRTFPLLFTFHVNSDTTDNRIANTIPLCRDCHHEATFPGI